MLFLFVDKKAEIIFHLIFFRPGKFDKIISVKKYLTGIRLITLTRITLNKYIQHVEKHKTNIATLQFFLGSLSNRLYHLFR